MNKFITNLLVFVWLGCHLFSHNWETESFSYANIEGTTRQQIHVYYPNVDIRTGINSCAVYIPGGGWKQHLANWGEDIPLTAHILLSSGFIVIYIDFQPTDFESYWPAQGNDWEAAMMFILDNHQYLGINPNNISGWGHSAGGHGIHYLREKGWLIIAVSWAGPADLTITPNFWQGLFGPGYSSPEYLQKAMEASPFYMVHQPPPITYTLLFHGTHDNVVPKEQSDLMFQALENNGHQVDYIVVENAGHQFEPYAEGVEVSLSFPEIKEMSAAAIIETVRELKQSRVKSAIVTKVEKKINRSFLRTEYCNLIFFENNPQNIENEVEVMEYRLYRKYENELDYVYLAAVPAGTTSFLDRSLTRELVYGYTYYVTCVGKIGGEYIESRLD
jgi:acetyl esterase/lipase